MLSLKSQKIICERHIYNGGQTKLVGDYGAWKTDEQIRFFPLKNVNSGGTRRALNIGIVSRVLYTVLNNMTGKILFLKSLCFMFRLCTPDI